MLACGGPGGGDGSGCEPADCTRRCVDVGFAVGVCDPSGMCRCQGTRDAGGDREVASDDGGLPEGVVVEDDAGAPDGGDAPSDGLEDDDAGGDIPWFPDGSGATCSGMGPTCPPDELCDIHHCPAMGGGTCVTWPIDCPAIDAPVCDCWGNTHANDCLRLLARRPLKHVGPCVPGEDPPECVLTYSRPPAPDEYCWGDYPTYPTIVQCYCDCRPECTSECRDVGLPTEGWYAVCPADLPDVLWGCRGERLIHLADCG